MFYNMLQIILFHLFKYQCYANIQNKDYSRISNILILF